MMDLATYTPMGDKKNSDFFEEYLPRVYDRRAQSGLNEIVGNMAAVVVQVEHGDGVNYVAELAAMGPYRLQTVRLTETHKVYVLQSQPEFPRLIVLEPLTATYEDNMTRWNMLYPLARKKPNARYIGEIYKASSTKAVREALEPQNIRFDYPGDTRQLVLRVGAPDLHVPVRLHLQPGRLRRRRPRRHRRPRLSARRSASPPSEREKLDRADGAAVRARHRRPGAGHRPPGHPDPGRRPRARAPGVPDTGPLLLLGRLQHPRDELLDERDPAPRHR